MKDTVLTEAVEKVVAIKMEAVDRLVKDLIEPIGDIGNPEKVIGKPFEQWTPEDFYRLTVIYGQKEPNPLSDFIFNKKLKEVKALEAEVK